jgi:hypothetical protein
MNRSFPYLRDAERTQRSPEEWRNQAVQAIERIHALRRVMGAPTSAVDRPDPEAALRQLLASAPAAKAALIAAGRDRKAIDAMSDAQAVLVNAALGYHGRRDDAIKRFFFPYWQSLTLRRSETKPGAESDQGVLDFALSLLPAIEKIQVSVARRQRQLAALRTVEALRLYAAAHAGQLPSGLDALEVPAPIDPVAGAPFRYRFAEGRAEFSSDPASGEGHPPTLRYEITVAGSGK